MATKRRKKETFSRWDPADYLKSEEDMVQPISRLVSRKPPMSPGKLVAAALGDIARARGMVRVAKETGLTREAVPRPL